MAVAQVGWAGTIYRTLERIEKQVACAANVGADVLLLPERVLHGCDNDISPETTADTAEKLGGKTCGCVVELAQKYSLAILAGFIERDGDNYYISQLVAQPDASRQVQRKYTPNEIETKGGIIPATGERNVFIFNGIKTAILICSDSGISHIDMTLASVGVKYLFIPTGGGGNVQDMIHEQDLMTTEGRQKYAQARSKVFIADAIYNSDKNRKIGFASANAVGPVGKQTCHQGHCLIVDDRRVVRAQIPGTIVLEHMHNQMAHAVLNFEE